MAELLIDQLRLMAERFPAETAYVTIHDGAELTFSRWDTESDRLAQGLLDAGVVKGDRVAVYLPSELALAWVTAYAAVHKAGAVAVPTSTRLAPRELEYVLSHCQAVAAFTGGETAATLGGIRSSLPDLRLAVALDIDTDADAGDGAPAGFVSWQDAGPAGAGPVVVPLDGDDMADVMYTSGTTGRPKGVVVRHRNAAMMPNGVPNWTGDGWLHASPLFTFAGIASVYNPMKLGMAGLYQPRFDAGTWLDVVEKRRPSAVFLVPAMAQLLLSHPRFDEADLSSVLMASVGSAPLSPDTFRRLREKMPQAWVSNNWGMTEAGSAYSSLPPEEAARRVGSVGKPVPPMTVRIVDDAGQELAAGGIGELLVSNPGKEREYFNDPEATADTWRDGWLHTGDLARVDEDGYLYIVGRKKDVIIRGGHNIHAIDVEEALLEHPDLREAAVAGVPHEVLGEDVVAWVVPEESAGDAGRDVEEIRAFLADRLADYKIPRRIVFVDELPRNATGKVMKHLLSVP